MIQCSQVALEVFGPLKEAARNLLELPVSHDMEIIPRQILQSSHPTNVGSFDTSRIV